MNAKKLKEYFEDPSSIDADALIALKQAVQDFPFSGALHMLYLKALQEKDSYLLPAQIKRSAVSVPDRSRLKAWYELDFKAKAPPAQVGSGMLTMPPGIWTGCSIDQMRCRRPCSCRV